MSFIVREMAFVGSDELIDVRGSWRNFRLVGVQER